MIPPRRVGFASGILLPSSLTTSKSCYILFGFKFREISTVPRYKPVLQRFQEKYVVNLETGCWDWQGAKVGMGYGVLSGDRGRSHYMAHRFSYEHHISPIPDGLIICHRCDNPGCVNPQHLFAADHKTNMRDMARKGRARALSASEVDECRQLHKNGSSYCAIAKLLGVSRSTVTRAIERDDYGDHQSEGNRLGTKAYTIITGDMLAAIKVALADETLSIMRIAKMFDVDRRSVRNIRDGKLRPGRVSKLTEQQVVEIIDYWQAGFRQAEIGEVFGVHQATVSGIVRGTSWKGLKSRRMSGGLKS